MVGYVAQELMITSHVKRAVDARAIAKQDFNWNKISTPSGHVQDLGSIYTMLLLT